MLPADTEALVVAMTLVPNLLSRNKSFAFYENAAVRRARERAALLKGIVRQLSGVQGPIEATRVVSGGDALEMRYRIPAVRLERRTLLTNIEYSCVLHLASRAGIPGFRATEDDRARILAVLKRLAVDLALD